MQSIRGATRPSPGSGHDLPKESLTSLELPLRGDGLESFDDADECREEVRSIAT